MGTEEYKIAVLSQSSVSLNLLAYLYQQVLAEAWERSPRTWHIYIDAFSSYTYSFRVSVS